MDRLRDASAAEISDASSVPGPLSNVQRSLPVVIVEENFVLDAAVVVVIAGVVLVPVVVWLLVKVLMTPLLSSNLGVIVLLVVDKTDVVDVDVALDVVFEAELELVEGIVNVNDERHPSIICWIFAGGLKVGVKLQTSTVEFEEVTLEVVLEVVVELYMLELVASEVVVYVDELDVVLEVELELVDGIEKLNDESQPSIIDWTLAGGLWVGVILQASTVKFELVVLELVIDDEDMVEFEAVEELDSLELEKDVVVVIEDWSKDFDSGGVLCGLLTSSGASSNVGSIAAGMRTPKPIAIAAIVSQPPSAVHFELPQHVSDTLYGWPVQAWPPVHW